MEKTFYTMVLVTVSVVLGVVIGETYAPISGNTVAALSARTAVIEARLESLALKYEELKLVLDAGR